MFDFSMSSSNKLTELQRQFTSVKERLKEAASEKERLQTEVHQLVGEKEQLSELKKRIEGEKNQLDKTVKEYRTESESILTDYTQAMAELRQTKENKENLQQMFTKTTQELGQSRERSRLLEMQRKEVQDKLSHMDAQVGEMRGLVQSLCVDEKEGVAYSSQYSVWLCCLCCC